MQEKSDYQHIQTEVQGHIAWLRFNRPTKSNALHYEHLCEIEAALLDLRNSATVRCVIVTGNGKHFSSGADLTDAGEDYKVPLVLRRRRMRMGERVIKALLDTDQITIAAWNGAAMGGGGCIAAACDFRIGTAESFLQLPEIDIGLNLMWKSLPLFTTLAGPARAKQLVVGGLRVFGPQLLDWGLLDELVSPEDLSATALAWAERYAAKPPVAAQMIKQSINQLAYAQDSAIMHMDTDQNMYASGTQDRKVAVQAYLEKSKPEFTGD